MVLPSEWKYGTTVLDPDGYELEVPKKSENRVYCPSANCYKHFDEDELHGLIQHLTNHGEAPRMAKDCPICGTTFKGTKHKIKNQTYCSKDCANEGRDGYGRREHSVVDLLNEIRQHYGMDTKDVGNVTKTLLMHIHEQHVDRDVTDTMTRLDVLNDVREQFGVQTGHLENVPRTEVETYYYYVMGERPE